jgi:hypothetical protein
MELASNCQEGWYKRTLCSLSPALSRDTQPTWPEE